MQRIVVNALVFFLAGTHALLGDDLLYRFEGDVLPYDPSAGWVIFQPCVGTCQESIENGHFVLRWPTPGGFNNYTLFIAQVPELPPPPPLWVEWSFRSNHQFGGLTYCDAGFRVNYARMDDTIEMHGDAARSLDFGVGVTGLILGKLHSFRYETLDGVHYVAYVDGSLFLDADDGNFNSSHFLQMEGSGGCTFDSIPNKVNEWDFVRYGTIAYGEQVVDSNPAAGIVSALTHPDRTRFTVTFDSPNYVYVDDISVSVADFIGVTPVAPMNYPMVTQTRRLDNGPPEVVEIVLDKPISHAATTTFTLTDGVATNIIEYTLAPGDADGDGAATLADFAQFQNCFRPGSPSVFCKTFDLNRNNQLTLTDHQLFEAFLVNP